ncbi:Protein roadkill [Colletotrichum spinosum]|uniref:Protein roadkill n=1 Tax=Colletotrichum spinosum TaxID=1347390 RepID=A0A4R8PPX6_9PEZI|nr:Protein roadkill [Colletotrichum spinosum]
MSDKYSDMTIRCGGRTFKTHKAIVCSQSSFFDKALNSSFKEGITNEVELPEDDPAAIRHMLEFMYKGDYSRVEESTAGCPDTDTQQKALAATARPRRSGFKHLHAYLVADKYDVRALRLLALTRFYRAVELTWMADEEFPDLVDELYATTTEQHQDLRDIVCRLVGFHLLDDHASAKKRMEPVMKKHGEFAMGVLDYYILSVRGDCAW